MDELNRARKKIVRQQRIIKTIEHHNNRLENDNVAKKKALETFYEKHRLIARHLMEKGVMKDWTKHELDVLLAHLDDLDNENKRLRKTLKKIADRDDYDGMDRIYYQELSIELIHIARKALRGDTHD